MGGHSNADADADAHAHTHANPDANPDANSSSNAGVHAHTCSHANPGSCAGAVTWPFAGAGALPLSQRGARSVRPGNGKPRPDGGLYALRRCLPHADADTHADAHADA